jgi:hypothetical protein
MAIPTYRFKAGYGEDPGVVVEEIQEGQLDHRLIDSQ